MASINRLLNACSEDRGAEVPESIRHRQITLSRMLATLRPVDAGAVLPWPEELAYSDRGIREIFKNLVMAHKPNLKGGINGDAMTYLAIRNRATVLTKSPPDIQFQHQDILDSAWKFYASWLPWIDRDRGMYFLAFKTIMEAPSHRQIPCAKALLQVLQHELLLAFGNEMMTLDMGAMVVDILDHHTEMEAVSSEGKHCEIGEVLNRQMQPQSPSSRRLFTAPGGQPAAPPLGRLPAGYAAVTASQPHQELHAHNSHRASPAQSKTSSNVSFSSRKQLPSTAPLTPAKGKGRRTASARAATRSRGEPCLRTAAVLQPAAQSAAQPNVNPGEGLPIPERAPGAFEHIVIHAALEDRHDPSMDFVTGCFVQADDSLVPEGAADRPKGPYVNDLKIPTYSWLIYNILVRVGFPLQHAELRQILKEWCPQRVSKEKDVKNPEKTLDNNLRHNTCKAMWFKRLGHDDTWWLNTPEEAASKKAREDGKSQNLAKDRVKATATRSRQSSGSSDGGRLTTSKSPLTPPTSPEHGNDGSVATRCPASDHRQQTASSPSSSTPLDVERSKERVKTRLQQAVPRTPSKSPTPPAMRKRKAAELSTIEEPDKTSTSKKHCRTMSIAELTTKS